MPHNLMAGGGLLALVDDGQCIIFEQLADSLAPRTALNLSACCRTLRTVSKAVCADLLQKHGAVRRLCDRVNTSYTAVADAEELLWYGQGLDATHMTTLGRIGFNYWTNKHILECVLPLRRSARTVWVCGRNEFS